MLKTDQLQFHVPVAPGDIGKWCILPGDPGRCEKIVRHLQNPVHVGQNREFNVWNGELDGETVTVCSTGWAAVEGALSAAGSFSARSFCKVPWGISSKGAARESMVRSTMTHAAEPAPMTQTARAA